LNVEARQLRQFVAVAEELHVTVERAECRALAR
jgi:hypothetical protein